MDARIAALGRRQHGIISRAQLIELGLGAKAIAYRARTGRLHRVHPGVYAVGHRTLPLRAQFIAAPLAAGDGAVLSHRSAAELHGLLRPGGGPIHVSSRRRRTPPPPLRHHQTRTLAAAEVKLADAIPVTAVARTLLGLADVAPRRTVERALDQAEVLRRFDLRELEATLTRANGRRGTAILRAALAAPPALTRSELEERFLALVDLAGIPRPQMNARVVGHEVDALFAAIGLVVEIDSFKYHRSRRAFESDRRRDIALGAAGLRTIRFTDLRIGGDPAAVIEDLVRAVDSWRTRSS